MTRKSGTHRPNPKPPRLSTTTTTPQIWEQTYQASCDQTLTRVHGSPLTLPRSRPNRDRLNPPPTPGSSLFSDQQSPTIANLPIEVRMLIPEIVKSAGTNLLSISTRITSLPLPHRFSPHLYRSTSRVISFPRQSFCQKFNSSVYQSPPLSARDHTVLLKPAAPPVEI